MDCKTCIEDLTAYLDGELSPGDTSQVKLHLASCVSCSGELQGLKQASDFIALNARKLDLNPGSWSRLEARISIPKSRSFFGLLLPIRWRIPAAVLTCAALIVFGFLWYQQVQQDSLNAYMEQYERAREAGRLFHRAVADVDTGFASDDYNAENPFVEARVGLDVNPFRSEGR